MSVPNDYHGNADVLVATAKTRQRGNLPFNFGGMTFWVPPFYRTADRPTLRGPHLDNLTFNFKGATRRSAPFRFTSHCLKCGPLADFGKTSAFSLSPMTTERGWIIFRFWPVCRLKVGDYPPSSFGWHTMAIVLLR